MLSEWCEKSWERIEKQNQENLNFISQDGKHSVLAFIIRHAASSELSSTRQFG